MALTAKASARALPLVGAQFACFLGVGAILPVLPGHAITKLGASGLAFGMILGVYPLASLLGRFVGGAASDRRGRRPALVVGLFGCSLAGFVLVLPLNVWALTGARFVHGLAQAVVSVAAVTWLMDITEPERRAGSLALIGTGVWGGVTVGTMIGGALGSLGAAGVVAAVSALAGIPALRWATAAPAVRATASVGIRVPMAAVVPGITFGLGAVGYAAIVGFVVLHLDGRGAAGALTLTAFSATVLVGRLVIVPAAARYGLLRTVRPVLVLSAAGLLVVGAATHTWIAVAGAVLVAIGHCVLWPALGALVASCVPTHERGTAIGAMTAFYDIAMGGASVLFGVLATGGGTGRIFLLAAGCVLVAAGFDTAFGGPARSASRLRPEPLVEAGPVQ